eukprot:5037298-Heterocapsa_arctica.AAC.1
MKCRSWRGIATSTRREKFEKLKMDEKERYRGELLRQRRVVRPRTFRRPECCYRLLSAASLQWVGLHVG